MKMTDDPIEDVFSYVERAYLRLQAGDILIRCLEDNSIRPIQQIVEGLILAGPQSLDELRQVLAEATARKMQVEDDLNQVYREMKRVLNEYKVVFPHREDFRETLSLTPMELLVLMKNQGVEDSNSQSACLQVFQDSRDIISNLSSHLALLTEIEGYIRDWLYVLTYQLTRQRHPNISSAAL